MRNRVMRLRLRANCVKSLLLRNPCARDNPRNHLSGSEEGVSPLVSHVSFRCRRIALAAGSRLTGWLTAAECRSPIPTTPLSWRPTITACRRLSTDLRSARDRASTSTLSFLSSRSVGVLEHFKKRNLARENPVVASPTTRIVLSDVVFFFPRGVFRARASVFGAVKTSACIFALPSPSKTLASRRRRRAIPGQSAEKLQFLATDTPYLPFFLSSFDAFVPSAKRSVSTSELGGRGGKSDATYEFRGNAFRAEHIALPHLQSKVVDATVGRQARPGQASRRPAVPRVRSLYVAEWALCVGLTMMRTVAMAPTPGFLQAFPSGLSSRPRVYRRRSRMASGRQRRVKPLVEPVPN
ncbi:hypothetical protein ALC57_03058 [Trachymyrmex cornetzi]|uniref:Uncharacterized protein n=1 Tax=Trachymyrmex cornetzi TaxID=471704 RepID=A0A151JMT1_9HYME|nr:hypothetical protein ALC57_03058 [Trachymyrmex cornetzi]